MKKKENPKNTFQNDFLKLAIRFRECFIALNHSFQLSRYNDEVNLMPLQSKWTAKSAETKAVYFY